MDKQCELFFLCEGRFPKRYIMASFCALGILILCGQRDNLSAGIAIGLRKARENDTSNTTFNETVSDVNLEEIDWSDIILHLVMFSFSIGFLGAQIPAGFFADRVSARWVYFTGATLSTVLTLLMPILLERTPYICVFCARILLGISQSVMYTSTSTLMAHWIPFSERSSIGGFVFGIYPFATTARRLVNDSLRTKIENWSISLYFWGSCGLVWCALFLPLVYNYPENHPHVKQYEKDFLEGRVPPRVKFPAKMGKILRHYGIWTLIVGQIGQNFVLHMTTGTLPWFLLGSSGLSMRDMNMLVIFSFLGGWLTSFLSGMVVDYGLNRKNWNVKWCRRIVVYVSINVPSICICLIYYLRDSRIAVLILFALATISMGPFFSSFCINHLDISLHFAGILHGTIICLSDLIGIVLSFTVKMSTLKIISRSWEIDSWVAFCLCLVTSTHYLFKARVKRAAWDITPEETQATDKVL